MRTTCLLGVALVLIGTGSGVNARPRVVTSVGTEVSSGRYGEAMATTIIDSAVSLKLRSGGWSLSAAASHVVINGPADVAVIEGGDGEGLADASSARRTRQAGLGDSTLAATYQWSDVAGTPGFLAVSGKVRLPTGDAEKGLGVGATDYFAGAETGIVLPHGGTSAKATRRFLGDTAFYRRRDGWQLEAGAWLQPNSTVQIGIDYEHRDPAFVGGVALQDADLYASLALSRAIRLQVTATLGLSRTAADRAIGAALSTRF